MQRMQVLDGAGRPPRRSTDSLNAWKALTLHLDDSRRCVLSESRDRDAMHEAGLLVRGEGCGRFADPHNAVSSTSHGVPRVAGEQVGEQDDPDLSGTPMKSRV